MKFQAIVLASFLVMPYALADDQGGLKQDAAPPPPHAIEDGYRGTDDAKKIFTDFNPNASLASWAIRYASSLENVLIVLSGMSNIEQLNDNMSYMKNFIPLSKDEYNVISKATELIKETIAVPCTACHYCTDGCPQKINIPRYFELFNDSKRYGIESYKWNYNDEKNKGGSPSDCISCHLCESNCPQKIEIVSMLKTVAEAFEG